MQEPETNHEVAPPPKKKSATKTVVIAAVTFLVIICGAGIFFAQPQSDPNATQAVVDSTAGRIRQDVPVVIAVKDLKAGVVVSDADVRDDTQRDDLVSQQAVTDKRVVVGYVTREDIKAGEVILSHELFSGWEPVAVAARDLKANTKLKASSLRALQTLGYSRSDRDVSKHSLIGSTLTHDVRAGKIILPSDISN